MTIKIVVLSKRVQVNFKQIPRRILRKFKMWVEAIEEDGIAEVRKIRSYHDKPLQGLHFGQRSIRLNHGYRAFYRVIENNNLKVIEVLEINKHDY